MYSQACLSVSLASAHEVNAAEEKDDEHTTADLCQVNKWVCELCGLDSLPFEAQEVLIFRVMCERDSQPSSCHLLVRYAFKNILKEIDEKISSP